MYVSKLFFIFSKCKSLFIDKKPPLYGKLKKKNILKKKQEGKKLSYENNAEITCNESKNKGLILLQFVQLKAFYLNLFPWKSLCLNE